MPEMTMSFGKGNANETSIKHNNRSLDPDKFDFDKAGHKHIKPEFTGLNEVLVHEDIRDVYKREFGKAVEEYNSKQKRKDRRIKDYYSKIKNSKKTRTQYEFIVQVGNKNDYDHDENRITSQTWQTSKKILENYFDNFQKRNPNLIPYNAVIHMDEEGAPHMHLNVVPVAHDLNAKQGVKVKPVLNKALAEEGFSISKKDNRKQWRDFQHREAEALADEAMLFGIGRKAGITNKLKDVHQYKQVMREIDDLQAQKSQIDTEFENKKAQIELLDYREESLGKQSSELFNKSVALNKREENLKKREEANAELDAERIAHKYHEKNISWAFMPVSRTKLSEAEKENARLREKVKAQNRKIAQQEKTITKLKAFADATVETIRLIGKRLPEYARSIWQKLGEKMAEHGADKHHANFDITEQYQANKGFERVKKKKSEEMLDLYRNLSDNDLER